MNHAIWSKRILFISSSIIFLVSLFNWCINPYNLFNHGLDKRFSYKPHLHSDRMSHFYMANHIQPQTVLIGTSRSGFFSEKQLIPYAPTPIYNYSMAGSSITEQAANIQYMITNHHPKTIIWSLDFFSFNPTKPINPAFKIERLTGSIYWNDYLFSLFNFKTFYRSFLTIRDNRSAPTNVNSTNVTNTPDQPYTEKEIDFNIHYTLHEYANEKSFLKSEPFKDPHSIDKQLALVESIVQECKRHNVQCILYTSPVYYQHIDMIYNIGLGDTFEYWKKSLASIAPYHDFCTNNSITENKMNFRDSSHIISHYGDLIFARIFYNTTLKIPSDFGTYINTDNVLSHLEQERNKRRPFSFNNDNHTKSTTKIMNTIHP